jgi:hypothetical protein
VAKDSVGMCPLYGFGRPLCSSSGGHYGQVAVAPVRAGRMVGLSAAAELLRVLTLSRAVACLVGPLLMAVGLGVSS